MRVSPPSGGWSQVSGRARNAHLVRCVLFSFALVAGALTTATAATLSGRLLDPDGRPVEGARVVLGTAVGTLRDGDTDADGRFDMPDLPAGRYTVRVVVDGLQADAQEVALDDDGRHDLTIQLRVAAVAESIVVSAAHVPVPRSASPQALTVITAADLAARQIETVAGALEAVPGITVAQSGGRGALTSVFPRGGASNYTLVLVDGIRTNAFGGAYDFAHLSVANVDRIEIVRGPQSALFGSEAIGAVVHVITKRGGGRQVDGVVEGGTQGTARMAIGASGSRGAWSWGFGSERMQSDGFAGSTTSGEPVANDDYTRVQATGSAAYSRTDGTEVTVAGTLGTDERGFPGPYGSDPIGVFPGVDRVSRGQNDTRRIGLRVVTPWSTSARQRVEVSYADLRADFLSPFGPSSSGTRRVDARVQEDFSLTGRVGASAGVELVNERGSFVTGGAGNEIAVERRAVGAFVETRVVQTERALVAAGLRLEHLVRRPVEADPLAFEPRPALPRQHVTSLNPKLSASLRLTPASVTESSTRVRASAGTGIRPPDVFEIAFTDNPDLKPERSLSVDAGVEQQILGGALVIDVGAFSNRYDALIVTVGRSLAAASRYRTDNISNARARGVEVSGRARLPRGFALATEYTWVSTAILSIDALGGTAPAPFQVGDRLIRRPTHQGRIDVSYASPSVTAFATAHARGRTLDIEPNFGSFGGLFETPGYLVVDAGLSVPVRRSVSVFGRVSNLTNRRYEEILGFPTLGRTGMVGVRVAAGH